MPKGTPPTGGVEVEMGNWFKAFFIIMVTFTAISGIIIAVLLFNLQAAIIVVTIIGFICMLKALLDYRDKQAQKKGESNGNDT